MSGAADFATEQGAALITLHDRALPQVYGYLSSRAGGPVVAGDLTAGSEVLSVHDYESGGSAECVDDQGVRFDLFRPRPGY